jgi:hypothetical protein
MEAVFSNDSDAAEADAADLTAACFDARGAPASG